MSRIMVVCISALLAMLELTAPARANAVSRRGAAGYPDSLSMTCAQAKSYIDGNDGAILATGDIWASFHSSYCSGQPAYVRTKDERLCYVGQYCDCETTYCSQTYRQDRDD